MAYFAQEDNERPPRQNVVQTPGQQPAQYPGIQATVQPTARQATTNQDGGGGGGTTAPPPPRPPAPTTPDPGSAGGAGSSAPSSAPPAPRSAEQPNFLPTGANPGIGGTGLTGGAQGSFKNIQNFLQANQGQTEDYAKNAASKLQTNIQNNLAMSGAIPTQAEVNARASASAAPAVSGTAPASSSAPNTAAIGQAQELGTQLGGASTPQGLGSLLQGGEGYTSGQRKLDSYLMSSDPRAMENFRNLQQNYGGLLGLVQSQTPKGATVDANGNVTTPTAPRPTGPRPAPGAGRNGNPEGVGEGETDGNHPGKVWDGTKWVGAGLYNKLNRDNGTGREPGGRTYTP